MTTAFDGQYYYHCSGGSGSQFGVSLSKIDPNTGVVVETYSPGISFRSIFTMAECDNTTLNCPIYSRGFNSNMIQVMRNQDGNFVDYLELKGGTLTSQEGVKFDSVRNVFFAQRDGALDRWNGNTGEYVDTLELVEYGTGDDTDELEYPEERGVAYAAGCGDYYVTYNGERDMLSFWSASNGSRLFRYELSGLGGSFSTVFSVSYANGHAFLVNGDLSSVFGYQICPACNHPGVKGDPHFTTWRGEKFDFHGKCDLELISDPTFAGGKGMAIHIRTEIVRSWAYIKTVAILLGGDVLEIQGGADDNRYWFNNVYQGEFTTIGDFPVMYKKANSKQRVFRIDLGGDEEIEFRTYKEEINIFLKQTDLYANTVGLLADFKSGKKLARDGVSIINDYNMFGQEWQVLAKGPKLFHELSGPQAPEQKCIMPSALQAQKRRRRLGESSVAETMAELACANVAITEREDCISDVQATSDAGIAAVY